MSTNENRDFYAPVNVVDLDDLDREILRILQKDCKTSLRKIAEHTEHSVSTIKSHIDRLIEEDVIQRFIAVVDCNKVGYREMLHFYLQIKTSVTIRSVVENLLKIRNINCIYHVSGDFPLFCIAKCVEKTDHIILLEKIQKIKGIEKITTNVVLKRLKEDRQRKQSTDFRSLI